MVRTAQSSTLHFHPCSRLIDFFSGYISQGLAQATLANLLPMYPSSSVSDLAQLQRYSSDRNVRAGDTAAGPDEPAIYVVMFKKFTSILPMGLTPDSFAQFFTDLFTYQTTEERDASFASTKALLENPHYIVLAITVPTFSSKDTTQLSHFIVAAALYMYDHKHGSFVTLIGVTDVGDPSICSLSDIYFIDKKNSGVLSSNSSFRGRGLASFLLSTIQVNSLLHYRPPKNSPMSTVGLSCPEIVDDDSNNRHHIYLQARVEMGSAYVMYVQMGFTTPAVENSRYRCHSYLQQCPVLVGKLSSSDRAGYITDDNFLRLLVLKRFLVNVFPPQATMSTTVETATNVWNTSGLPPHQFLSSALIPPLNNPDTRVFTNAAYLQLLRCRANVGTQPLQFYAPLLGETYLLPIPVDRCVSKMTRDDPGHHMIAGLTLDSSDIRLSMFRSLLAFVGDKAKFDLFQAIAASL
jgi:hypothetical protein